MSIFYLDPHEGTCLNKLGELVDKKFFQILVALLLFVF